MLSNLHQRGRVDDWRLHLRIVASRLSAMSVMSPWSNQPTVVPSSKEDIFAGYGLVEYDHCVRYCRFLIGYQRCATPKSDARVGSDVGFGDSLKAGRQCVRAP